MVGGMGQQMEAMREVRLCSLYRIWQRHTALGGATLYNTTTGSDNTAVGQSAGANLTSGDHNISLGNVSQAGDAGLIWIGAPLVHIHTYLPGSVHATSVGPSDARLKTNIAPLTQVLEKLEQLRGWACAWNDASAPLTGHAPEHRDIGVIAQGIDDYTKYSPCL